MTLREITLQLADLLDRKRDAYGDSIATSEIALSLFYPHGVPPEAFGDVLLIARVWDKLQRIATGRGSGEDESPWLDIAGYGICGVHQHQQTLQLQEISRAWQGNANGPAASSTSQEPAASAPPPTSEPTRSNASATPAPPATPPSSPPPDALSQLEAAAHAPTALAATDQAVNRQEYVSKKYCQTCYLGSRRGYAYDSARQPITCPDPFHDARGHPMNLTPLQLKRLHVLYRQYEARSLDTGSGKGDRLAWASAALKRTVDSFNEISLDEARTLIDGLQRALGVKVPSKAPRRAPSRREREKQGTEGRRDQLHAETTVAGPRELQMIDGDLAVLGWDRTRFNGFLASKYNPNKGRTEIRTLGDANRIHWALMRLIRHEQKPKASVPVS